MVRTLQTAHHLTLMLLTLAALTISFPGLSHAASGQVSFVGHVTKPTQNNSVNDYPVELVSFGNQAMLPLSGLATGAGEVRVFDANGRRLHSGGTTYVPSNGQRLPAQLVNLAGSGQQVFIVCKGGLSNCLRYRVNRH